MSTSEHPKSNLAAPISIHDLSLRIEEAQETLAAIRSGLVDALVVKTGQDQQLLLLKGADQAYHVLFETLNEGAVSFAGDGAIAYANRRFAELVGHPFDEIRGTPLEHFVAPADAERFRAALADSEQGSSKCELSLLRADGTLVPVMLSLRALGDPSSSAHTAVVTDLRQIKEAQATLEATHAELLRTCNTLQAEIAERVRLENELRHAAHDLAEAGHRKDEFLAMLSHELRNPLASILHCAELLRRELEARPAGQRYRDIIERQAANLTCLVDDLLDLSRITRDKITLRKRNLDLSAAVRAAVETVRSQADAHGHQLSVVLPSDWVPLSGDPVRLEQILVNLLTNAIKFTPNGGHIEVVLERRGDEATVRVRDDGIGISANLLPSVFDIFVQGQRGPDRAEGGLGIGLALVKRLTEMHGGRVEARSEGAQRGSEFVIYLPLQVTKEERATAAASPAEAYAVACAPAGDKATGAREPPRPRRVLIVEDDEDAAEVLRALLEGWGHDVCVAHDGPRALELVPSFAPEIVFIDIGLPGMDGLEVARRLRRPAAWMAEARNPPGPLDAYAAAPLPTRGEPLLVALSGYGQDETRQAACQAGFDDYLVKPASPSVLRQVLYREGRAQVPAPASRAYLSEEV